MIINNLLISIRNIRRNKSTLVINLLGLSIGLACAFLILLWVEDELGIDKFHENEKQLYQVFSNHEYTSGTVRSKATTGMLVQTLPEKMPEIEKAACVVNFGDDILISSDKKNIQANGKFGSTDFFQMFSFPLLKGNIQTVLSDKDAIVISEKVAQSLFNTTDNVIGKPVEIGHQDKYIVSGVFMDIPENSSLKFDFMLSFEGLKSKSSASFMNWGNTGPRTFILLKKQTNVNQFRDKIKNFVRENSRETNTYLTIQRFSETYLKSNDFDGVVQSGRIAYVRLFSIIAVFILAIACINFMNLASARAAGRTKEVAIKKALGSSRGKLILQFMQESIIMSVAAMILALLLVSFFLPEFNLITQKHLSIQFDLRFFFLVTGLTLFTGLLAGSYPALYLSGFNSFIMKTLSVNSGKGSMIRKGLVVFQFAISAILIVAVLVVNKQIKFIQSQGPGFSKDNVIYFRAEGRIGESKDAFLMELKKIPGVINVTCSDHTLIGHEHTTSLSWEGKNPDDNIAFEFAFTGYNVAETFGLEMSSGRSFSSDYGDEASKIILNETAIKAMGIHDPIGKKVDFWGKKEEIIGIVKDFHFESFHEKIKPLFFKFNEKESNLIMVRLKAYSGRETISRIEALYEKFNAGFIFDYKYLDQDFQNEYLAEQRASELSRYFAGIAILITCLGLIGLVAYTVERRSKEIALRKISGSNEFQIINLLSMEFTSLVILALLISLPSAYLIARLWLGNFAYRTDLGYGIFITAGLSAMAIACITVSWVSWKAATRNPVDALRHE